MYYIISNYIILNNIIMDLFRLVYDKQYDSIIKLLKNDKNGYDLNNKDKYNNYLLTYAIINNHFDLIKVLIENGARIDIIDQEGYTILYYIIRFNYFDILKYILDYNDSCIGISIVNLIDKHGYISSYYAIKYNNIDALKLLIKHNLNLYIKDYTNGYNILHQALYSRNIDIIKYIIDQDISINNVSNSGESPLHIVTNLQLIDILDYILQKKNINVNIAEFDSELTPLHYALNLNNLYISTQLIKHGAGINMQDVYGQMSLHICVLNRNREIFDVLIKEKSLNYNIWNYHGNTPLHMLFEKYSDNDRYFIEHLIPHTNVNLQNNTGDSVLHYITKHNLWGTYRDLLVKKKLNIFVLNKKNEKPIDFVKPTERDSFLKFISDSYLNRLRTYSIDFEHSWQNICKNPLFISDIDTTPLDIAIINKIKGEKKSVKKSVNRDKSADICADIIFHTLKKNLDDTTQCSQSYPLKKNSICLKLSEGSPISTCNFTGTIIDVLFGIIYVSKKYSSVCNLLHPDITISSDLYTNKQYRIDNFMNIEILWINNNIYFDEKFDQVFEKCISNPKKRYIIAPIGIIQQNGAHANYILYDKKLNELERFEPHGATATRFDYNYQLLDTLLENKFKTLLPNKSSFKYYRPTSFMEKISLQQLEGLETNKKKINDMSGYCVSWSLWYIDMRILYQDISRKKLISKLIQYIKMNNISFKNLIRNYSNNISTIRDTTLSKIGTDINKLLYDSNETEYKNTITQIIKSYA